MFAFAYSFWQPSGEDSYNPSNQTIHGEIGSNENPDGEGLGEQNKHPYLPYMKQKYKRHSLQQLKDLEASFDKCANPNEKERKKMATELGLKPQQIKFWFQNKRTQIKAQLTKQSPAFLRQENEKLATDNMLLWDTYNNCFCSQCIGVKELSLERRNLLLENSKLKEKLQEIEEQIARSKVKAPLMDLTNFTPPSTPLEASYLR